MCYLGELKDGYQLQKYIHDYLSRTDFTRMKQTIFISKNDSKLSADIFIFGIKCYPSRGQIKPGHTLIKLVINCNKKRDHNGCTIKRIKTMPNMSEPILLPKDKSNHSVYDESACHLIKFNSHAPPLINQDRDDEIEE